MISLKKLALSVVVIGIVSGALLIPGLVQDPADAKSTKKVHFTKTYVSSQDPGQGREGHQLAMLLSPRDGIIYDGSLTFAADRPVRVAILHEIDPSESRGQPVWTVDGNTIYGISIIDSDGASGSAEFTGAALALHNPSPEPFVATASVDGWIRGGTVEFVTQKIEVQHKPQAVDLYRASVPATIPMHSGLYDGNRTLYIITDAGDEELAQEISERQDWNVEVSAPLMHAPESALGKIYFFTNGIHGEGLYGFQDEVFSSTPEQHEEYSALRKAVNISWRVGQNPDTLNSVDDVMQAEKNGRIEIEDTGVVVNAPQIVWPGGQMPVREDSSVSDDTPYGGGQILEINEEENTVTFVAHRGWGPDGRTIYYIITDATPSGPAGAMGVVDAPSSAELIANAAAVDLYQFKNGLEGPGPLGFQPGISVSAPGDEAYSPMWRIFLVEWNNEDEARLLETIDDINSARGDGAVTVSIARPTSSDHIVNCPFIDPFQNLKAP